MARTRYAWREEYLSALGESDPKRLIAHIQKATTALERRHAEWGANPGTPAELKAIQKAIATLEGVLKEKLNAHFAMRKPVTRAAESPHRPRNPFVAPAKRLLTLLQSSPLHGKQL